MDFECAVAPRLVNETKIFEFAHIFHTTWPFSSKFSSLRVMNYFCIPIIADEVSCSASQSDTFAPWIPLTSDTSNNPTTHSVWTIKTTPSASTVKQRRGSTDVSHTFALIWNVCSCLYFQELGQRSLPCALLCIQLANFTCRFGSRTASAYTFTGIADCSAWNFSPRRRTPVALCMKLSACATAPPSISTYMQYMMKLGADRFHMQCTAVPCSADF